MIENKPQQPGSAHSTEPFDRKPVVPAAPVAPQKPVPVVEKKKTEAELKAEQVRNELTYLRDNVLHGNPEHVAKIDQLLKLVS